MTPPDRIAILNQLLRRLSASLPVYASQVPLWSGLGDEPAAETLSRIAADDQHLAHRLAEAVRRAGGRPAPASFPAEYTGLHDVSVRYVLKRVAAARQSDLGAARCWASQLGDAAPEGPLVHEILRTLEGHVQTLSAMLSSQEPGADHVGAASEARQTDDRTR